MLVSVACQNSVLFTVSQVVKNGQTKTTTTLNFAFHFNTLLNQEHDTAEETDC